MPRCLHKLEVLPRQVQSESERETLSAVADWLFGSITTTGVVVFTLSFVLGASTSLLWGLINTHQNIVYLPMLELAKFPANANILNEILIRVASFEFLPFGDYLNEKIFHFPETDPISLGAKMCKITSIFLVDNLGSKYWAAKF